MPSDQPIFIFTDLDDCLFQTRRKCPDDVALTTAAVDRQGAALSYCTPQQQALLALLGNGTLIPVTGRNTAAVKRVQIPFASFRITSHGALVFGANGQLDPDWLALRRDEFAFWGERMQAVTAQVQALLTDTTAVRCRIIDDHDWPVYVSIKGAEQALDALSAAVQELWSDPQAHIHRNGENMALLPPYARKEQAVAFLMERLRKEHSNPLFIGLGDSVTDVPFLALCHYAMTPRTCQIRSELWR